MSKTKIEWTDRVWNPVTGCTKVSQGCKNCYAERISKRFGVDFATVHLHPERLNAPLHWQSPSMIFVNSMSDLFHESVPFEFVHHIWDIMKRTPRHTYQILTKRPEQMHDFASRIYQLEALGHAKKFWSHVWLGVSVEDQETADERIPLLLQTPASVRFVSYEPALGPVDFTFVGNDKISYGRWNALTGDCQDTALTQDIIEPNGSGPIDWLICGGESGPNARPMHPDWARAARDQCQAADVPFFFKQWGEWAPVYYGDRNGKRLVNFVDTKKEVLMSDPNTGPSPVRTDLVNMRRVGKKKAGRLLDGREWKEFPQESR